MSTAIVEKPESLQDKRKRILREIKKLESQLAILRVQLPKNVRSFFRFRLEKPAKSFMFAYAVDLETAKTLVFERLSKDYPDNFELHPKVDLYRTPGDAAVNSQGNLLRG